MTDARFANRNARTKTMSFTSGKGGVGKTTMVTNIAVQMAERGHRVLILDGDLGMANVDVMFKVRSRHSIMDVIEGNRMLEEVIVPVTDRISLIPGGSGIYELTKTTPLQKQTLLSQVSDLEQSYDFMLIDTAPGIDDNVLYLNSAAQEINVVVTPDPSSMTDAYALIKVLHQRKRENRFSIICNQVKDESEGYRIFQRLVEVASRFLCVSLDYKGSVPADAFLRQATRSNQVVSLCNRRAPSSVSFRDVSEKLCGRERIGEAKGGLQFFWHQFVGVA